MQWGGGLGPDDSAKRARLEGREGRSLLIAQGCDTDRSHVARALTVGGAREGGGRGVGGSGFDPAVATGYRGRRNSEMISRQNSV